MCKEHPSPIYRPVCVSSVCHIFSKMDGWIVDVDHVFVGEFAQKCHPFLWMEAEKNVEKKPEK
jgi:hypothetical protein